MAIYKVEMMDKGSFNNYMSGYWNYSVKKIDVEAKTAEEAIAIAKALYPEMVINEGWVKTLKELAAIEAEKVAEAKANAEKEAAKKTRKAEREAAKAAEMGLTIEEYTERKKLAAMRARPQKWKPKSRLFWKKSNGASARPPKSRKSWGCKKPQFFLKIFKKTLDNRPKVCYNLIRKKRKGNSK